jgi:hypothetical protein
VPTIWLLLITALAAISALGCEAQDVHPGMDMPGQNPAAQSTGNMPESGAKDNPGHKMDMDADSMMDILEQHATAGTDAEPDSTPVEMLMTRRGKWMLMFHGEAFLNETQQTGGRGADKLFSTNWFMPMAQHQLGGGTITLRAMLSLEPATITGRRYPELFEEGETAFGKPIVDGQHPHDLFMELGALYDDKVGEHTLLSFYAAPVGDPALGPLAYPHRASASEDPIAPLGHHLEDSTHIADEVITLGVTHRGFRVEASGFHGREPDEFRWNIDFGRIDSWSTRISVNLQHDWSFQYSIGQLHSPEALDPHDDIRRMTASVMYNRRLRHGNWASMLLWGRNQSLVTGNVGNAYLAESTLQFLKSNHVWTRIENVDRSNDLLLGENVEPPGFVERYMTRVEAYTAGYDREVGHVARLSTAVGSQLTWYGVPADLKPIYGSHPFGVVAFLRLRFLK